ncbi:MAG: hypothetical protein WAP48_02385 [Sediminibacterium sp.]
MMKKILLLLLLLTGSFTLVQAQLLNYQGIARNANGVALSFQNISIRLSIRDGSANGTTLYSETREVRTNQFGLITLVIGSPGAVSSFGNISTINWAASSKFLQVEIDPQGGSNFLHAGTSQLQSVPYAFFANAAYPVGNAGGDLAGSTYPNPLVAPLAINNSKLSIDAVTNEKIKDGTIENIKLVNSSIGLNGLPLSLGGGQSFAVGATGTNMNIVSSGTIHTFNFPNASATNRGVLTSADWSSFNNKLSAGDTAAMLNGYLRKNFALLLQDTSAAFSTRPLNNRFLDTATALQSRIQNKLNITDTTTMLNGYLRKDFALLLQDTSAVFSTRPLNNRFLDTATALQSRIQNKLNITDTTTMLNGYLRKDFALLLQDTSAAFSARPLNNRFLDTATALQSRIQTKLNITDTTAMLNGYLRKDFALLLQDTSAAFSARPLNNRFLDTATALQSRIQNKLLISDTTTMLNGYLRKDFALLLQDTSAAFSARPLNNRFLDTATALQSRIQNKLNITDTTTMLSNRLLISDTTTMLSGKWSIIGNALPTVGNTHFLGSTNNQPLRFKVNNIWAGELNPGSTNTSFGVYAGENNSSPVGNNSAFGVGALNKTTTGTDNTAVGFGALNQNIVGTNNTAVGQNALQNNTAGSNTAVGQEALKNNTTGKNNTAIGYNALLNNVTTDNNTAIGYNAGVSIDGLTNSTAIGYNASVTASNTIQLGNTGISDVKTSGGYTGARFIGNSAAPVVAIVGSSQAGTGASVSISGNDVAGIITLNVGTAPAAGAGSGGTPLITVSFNSAYANAPVVLIQPVNTTSGSTGPDTNLFIKPSSTTVSAFTIVLKSSIALADSGTYEIAYHVLGR